MLGDSNSTSTHWLAHPQSLAWIRQGRPGATEEWAWEELQRELLKAACGASEGVPIDKFRYPWADRMVASRIYSETMREAYRASFASFAPITARLAGGGSGR